MKKRASIILSAALTALLLFSTGFDFPKGSKPLGEFTEKIVHFGKVLAEKRGNRIVLINWTTLKETESFKFIIERSDDKLSFFPIGELGANRSSDIPISYSFSDLNPLKGNAYYRIKVLDREQHSAYSDTLVVFFDPDNKGLQLLQAFPNPFLDTIRVQYSLPEEGKIRFQLFSEGGREILSGHKMAQKGKNTFVLIQDDLPNGRYVLGMMGKDRILKAVELLKK